jgi:hypothetical protein
LLEALLLTLTEALEDAEGLSVLLPVAVVLCVALTEPDAEALALTDGLALLLTEPEPLTVLEPDAEEQALELRLGLWLLEELTELL